MPDSFGNATHEEKVILKHLNKLALELLKSLSERPFDYNEFRKKNTAFKTFYDANPCQYTHNRNCPYWNMADLLEKQITPETHSSHLDGYCAIVYGDACKGVVQYEILTRPPSDLPFLLKTLEEFQKNGKF